MSSAEKIKKLQDTVAQLQASISGLTSAVVAQRSSIGLMLHSDASEDDASTTNRRASYPTYPCDKFRSDLLE